MSHPRIEEVSDGDSDPSEGDIDDLDFNDADIIKDKRAPPSRIYNLAPADPSKPHPAAIPANFINPASIPSSSNSQARAAAPNNTIPTICDPVLDPKYKTFQCIYPVYFDKNRSRQEGRRVGINGAVENPLAREISNACARLGLETLFEPEKTHPKDWSNPGRVKVRVKGAKNTVVNVKNKSHLYTLISKHLIANPTTPESAASLRIRGVLGPDQSKPYPEAAIPKGWKMNKILPFHSPAMTGGGVSENFFKDMMGQMAGTGIEGLLPNPTTPSAGSGSGKPKKEKKKIIRV